MPRCCFSSPQAASVGLTLSEALELGIEAAASRAGFGFNIRSQIEGETSGAAVGWVKLVWEKITLRLLGCQIVGAHAAELIGEAALAIRAELSLPDLAATLRAHPSRSETLAEAARQGLHFDVASMPPPDFGGDFPTDSPADG